VSSEWVDAELESPAFLFDIHPRSILSQVRAATTSRSRSTLLRSVKARTSSTFANKDDQDDSGCQESSRKDQKEDVLHGRQVRRRKDERPDIGIEVFGNNLYLMSTLT
jgi:hypothetical protein